MVADSTGNCAAICVVWCREVALCLPVVGGRRLRHLTARTLTVDVDGTVPCTGQKEGGAYRGYNPHHRKVPSYYPITAYLADSGHFLRVHNRPGNVNDGSSSVPFLQAVFAQIEETLGTS